MSSHKNLLIDGDMIAFRIAAEAESVGAFQFDPNEPPVLDPSAEGRCKGRVDDYLADLQHRLNGRLFLVALSVPSDQQFRRKIYPAYKANRIGKPRPSLLDTLKTYLRTKYKAIVVPGLEADDILGIKADRLWQRHERNYIVVSNDKDFDQIVGQKYNPVKNIHTFTHPDDVDYFWLTQTLTGDTADGYPGCPGTGPVKAKALLEPIKHDFEAMWDAVLQNFGESWIDPEDVLVQAQISRILRGGDWDKSTGVKLWTPPQPSVSTPTKSPQTNATALPAVSASLRGSVHITPSTTKSPSTPPSSLSNLANSIDAAWLKCQFPAPTALPLEELQRFFLGRS